MSPTLRQNILIGWYLWVGITHHQRRRFQLVWRAANVAVDGEQECRFKGRLLAVCMWPFYSQVPHIYAYFEYKRRVLPVLSNPATAINVHGLAPGNQPIRPSSQQVEGRVLQGGALLRSRQCSDYLAGLCIIFGSRPFLYLSTGDQDGDGQSKCVPEVRREAARR